jgi:hypothetical protein
MDPLALQLEIEDLRDQLEASESHVKWFKSRYMKVCDLHFDAQQKLREKVKVEKKKVQSLSYELLGFIEYFGAIERGEVGESRPRIRTFEKILLDKAREAIKSEKENDEN